MRSRSPRARAGTWCRASSPGNPRFRPVQQVEVGVLHSRAEWLCRRPRGLIRHHPDPDAVARSDRSADDATAFQVSQIRAGYDRFPRLAGHGSQKVLGRSVYLEAPLPDHRDGGGRCLDIRDNVGGEDRALARSAGFERTRSSGSAGGRFANSTRPCERVQKSADAFHSLRIERGGVRLKLEVGEGEGLGGR